MFERFTEEARHVVVMAQEEARTLQHSYIGTEHILLGLVRDEEQRPEGERPLRALGVTLAEARKLVARLVPAGEDATSGQIPFTPRAKKVLELSLREALNLGHSWIGPEHILLGLAREDEGVAARVLFDLDVDAEAIRGAVIGAIGEMPARQAARVVRGPGGRLPADAAWFDGLGETLARLARQIRDELGREPDLGDLLLTVACATHTLGGAALHELGVDIDALWGTLERIRQDRKQESEELDRRITALRDQKRQALQNEQFQEAARLRDQERELTERRRSQPEQDVLREVRRRLGIPTPEE